MKKWYFILAAVALCAFSSCDPDEKYKDIDGTHWSIFAYEDYFKGVKVGEDLVTGTIEASFYQSPYFDLSVPSWNIDVMLFKGDYKIIQASATQLTIEVFYQEYENLKLEDVEYDTTFMGTKIYYWAEGNSLVYFNYLGKAVDVARELAPDGDYYYFDCTRLQSSLMR